MKDYKYKINGNDYKVSIGDIENNIAHVEVNGVPYNVEIQETKAAPVSSGFLPLMKYTTSRDRFDSMEEV